MAGGNNWGPKPPQSPRNSGGVSESSLGAAVGHLHKEHPHPVQGEGLQHKSTSMIHHPVSSGVYKGH